MLTAERARELFEYDAETGWLTWRVNRPNVIAGTRAGKSKTHRGHSTRHLIVGGKLYKEHRVIWLIVTGHWPVKDIDHKNHDSTDNRWANLRETTHSQNMRNQKLRSTNTSGIMGVSKRGKSFVASIKVNGVQTHLGSFPTIEEAIEARKAADNKYGFHDNHGRNPTTF